MTQRTVLVVEDEPAISAAVATRLRQEGFRVECAIDGPSGVELCSKVDPDVVVLDLMLPGFDGLEVCRRIQADKPVPVIMLTARDSETDVLVGLGVGADDYMTKPFSPRELVARVHAVLRRTDRVTPQQSSEFTIGEIKIDVGGRRVHRSGDEVHLTATEFDLLHHLAANAGMVFTREQLLADVWQLDGHSGLRTVDSHVRALRRKLDPWIVRTVHGVGYALGDSG